MNFKIALSVVLLSVAGAVVACPTLPDGSAFEMKSERGPDFSVCYATERGTNATAFGVYFGEHPSFDRKGATKLGKGRVAGRDVVWYKKEPADSKSPLNRETIIEINKRYGAVAHVWVLASTEEELKRRLLALEQIAFGD